VKGVKDDCNKVRIVRYLPMQTYKGQTKGVQSLEQRVESRNSVVVAVLALESSSVESDVPICQLVDKSEQTRHDGIQSVGWRMISQGNIKIITRTYPPFLS
jgi:hypothetical protein